MTATFELPPLLWEVPRLPLLGLEGAVVARWEETASLSGEPTSKVLVWLYVASRSTASPAANRKTPEKGFTGRRYVQHTLWGYCCATKRIPGRLLG